MMSPLAELRQKLLVRGSERGAGPVAAYVEWLTRRPQDVDWVSGACLLVRRADAEVVGLMDERYFMYAEDVDFCAAVRGRGRKRDLRAGRGSRAPSRAVPRDAPRPTANVAIGAARLPSTKSIIRGGLPCSGCT